MGDTVTIAPSDTVIIEGEDMKITVREAAQAYSEYASSLGLADTYLRTQQSYLRRFTDCCDGSAKDFGQRPPVNVGQLSPQYISRFFQGLPATRASHNRALSALRSFAGYLERMKHLEPGASGWLLGDRKAKTSTRKPKYYIPVSQFGPMLDAAERRHPADRMILALAFYTLGRKSEIAGLRFKDVDLRGRTIRIYRGKRKRWTVVQICPELWDELLQWLNIYARLTGHILPSEFQYMMQRNPDWYLAPYVEAIKGRAPTGEYDASLTRHTIDPEKPATRLERLVKRMLDIFGAQTEDGRRVRHLGEGMHTIRRSGARAMIDYLATVYGEDKALLMVSTMLDHDTTTMTLLYIGRNIEQKRLNKFLETNSMYGDHGRASLAPSNVTRMPLRGSVSHSEPFAGQGVGDYTPGEVDAL